MLELAVYCFLSQARAYENTLFTVDFVRALSEVGEQVVCVILRRPIHDDYVMFFQ